MKWTLKRFLWLALAALCIFTASSPTAQAGTFSLVWQYTAASGWAEHPIIHSGVVYVPWNDGKLTALDVNSGKLLHSQPLVTYATAPFVANNHLYS